MENYLKEDLRRLVITIIAATIVITFGAMIRTYAPSVIDFMDAGPATNEGVPTEIREIQQLETQPTTKEQTE